MIARTRGGNHGTGQPIRWPLAAGVPVGWLLRAHPTSPRTRSIPSPRASWPIRPATRPEPRALRFAPSQAQSLA